MIYVVGSGPAGIAAAHALLVRGRSVTLLDAGLDLEPDKEKYRKQLSQAAPGEWPPDALTSVKMATRVSTSGVPLKYVFGSDFPFRVPTGVAPLHQTGAVAWRSFARGGLSRAWGATILPNYAPEVADWPVSMADLAPHYEAVMRWMPLAAAHDDLDEFFPFYTAQAGDLPPSPQAASLLADLQAHRTALRQEGFVFGRARLAVYAPGSHGAGCVLCGLCLYGCPYGVIYSADQTLRDLQQDSRFAYVPGVLVRRVKENTETVTIEAADLASGEPRHFEGERVFLAAGVFNTVAIVAESLGLRDHTFELQTSQAFLVPLLRKSGTPGIFQQGAHTLSQIYLYLQDPVVARYGVQLQVYPYSDLMARVVDESLVGPVVRRFRSLRSALLERLLVVQGLLHSRDSDPIRLRVANGVWHVEGHVSSQTKAVVRRVLRKLSRNRRLLGVIPVTPLLKISLPGQSFHTSGAFPMATRPGPLESDRWGRCGSLKRVHAVDAAILPTVPATTMTLTMMANAHRIASHVDDY